MDRNNKKGNIICIRVTDEERDDIQNLMETRNKKISTIMREALALFREQWEMSRHVETVIEH
jgi:predicted transcriptional regulator